MTEVAKPPRDNLNAGNWRFDSVAVRLFRHQEPERVTISSGAITITSSNVMVDTESAAASDDLDTINAFNKDHLQVILFPATDARTVVIKHGTGNIQCAGNADITLDDDHDYAILAYNRPLGAWMASFSGLAHAQAHGTSQHTENGNWKVKYTDGSGDEQEVALGASSTFLRSGGTATAPTLSAIGAADLPTATTAAQGASELATAAEAAAGTSDSRVPTVSLLPVLIQDSKYTYAADAEASDTYAITLTPAPVAYAAGQCFIFKANTANTGAATLNVNSLGAVTIKKNHDADLANNDIESGSIVVVVHDGTNFQMVSHLANAAAGGDVATDAIWDAKGDLAGGTGANTAARLAVGTNDQVLTADSTQATGLKWAAGGGAPTSAATSWARTGDISVTVSANTNNWAPTGMSTASVIRVSGCAGANYNITGLTGGTDGLEIEIQNVDASFGSYTLVHQSGLSTVANRFSFPLQFDGTTLGPVILFSGDTCVLRYDATATRWKLVSGPARDTLDLRLRSAKATADEGSVVLYGFQDVLYETITQGGLGLNVIPGEAKAMQLAPGQMGFFVPTAATMQVDGMFGEGLTVTGTPTYTLDANGTYVTYTSGTVSGNEAGISSAILCRRDAQFWGQVRFKLPTTTSVRMFIGWTNQTLATMAGSDTPAGEYWGISYSTVRGDANWQLLDSDGVTVTATDLGVAVSTNWLHWRNVGFASVGLGLLFSSVMASLGGSSAANGPASTTGLRFVAVVETQTGAARTLMIQQGLLAQTVAA